MNFQRKEHGRGHSYYLDGTKLPGVTTVLDSAMRQHGLEKWAAEITAKYAVDRWDDLAQLPVSARLDALTRARWEARDTARLTGTKVHGYAENLVHGRDVEIPDEYVGAAQALARFMDAWSIEPVMTERPVFHDTHKWGGTFDLVAGIRGTLWLLDWKTGKGIYSEVALQLAAYNHATHVATPGGGPPREWAPAERCGAVHITADSATLYPVVADDAAYLTFRYCQQVAAWADRVAEARKAGEAWPVLPALDPAEVAA